MLSYLLKSLVLGCAFVCLPVAPLLFMYSPDGGKLFLLALYWLAALLFIVESD